MATSLPQLDPPALEEAIRTSEVPLVVDFWAGWCPPCRAMTPALEALAAERPARLRIVAVNTDQHPQLAARYGVMGLPTLLVFSNRVVTSRITGYRGAVRLGEELEASLRG